MKRPAITITAERTGAEELRDAPARPRSGSGPGPRPGAAAFTLIELILVLSLLLIVTGVSLPSLKNFFRNHNLDSEARRFLSLTRYAQARAAAEGVPMVLWIDLQEQTYGLQAEAGYVDLDRKAVEYPLDEGLAVEVSAPPLATPSLTSASTPLSSSLPLRSRAGQSDPNLPAIRVTAEGFFEGTSPETIVFHQADAGIGDPAGSVWITQSGNRLNYEIRNQAPSTYRR